MDAKVRLQAGKGSGSGGPEWEGRRVQSVVWRASAAGWGLEWRFSSASALGFSFLFTR